MDANLYNFAAFNNLVISFLKQVYVCSNKKEIYNTLYKKEKKNTKNWLEKATGNFYCNEILHLQNNMKKKITQKLINLIINKMTKDKLSFE